MKDKASTPVVLFKLGAAAILVGCSSPLAASQYLLSNSWKNHQFVHQSKGRDCVAFDKGTFLLRSTTLVESLKSGFFF